MIARRPRRWVRLTWRANPHWHHLPGELVPHLFIVSASGSVGYVESRPARSRLLYLGLALAAGALIAWALLLVLLGRGRS
jgi:hypothetical protein